MIVMMMMKVILNVAGPQLVAELLAGTKRFEVVRVGGERLVGKIIRLEHDTASIQVNEDTSGLTVGDPVVKTAKPRPLELGPRSLDGTYDGIQRPLGRPRRTRTRTWWSTTAAGSAGTRWLRC